MQKDLVEYRDLRHKELIKSELQLNQARTSLQSRQEQEEKLLSKLQSILAKQDEQKFYLSSKDREIHAVRVRNLELSVVACLCESPSCLTWTK